MKLENFSLEELKSIRSILEEEKDINSVLNKIDTVIETKKIKEINERFNMEYLEQAFTPQELTILQMNGIQNLEQLHNADLGSFKGITKTDRKNIEMLRNILYYKGDAEIENKSQKRNNTK